MNKQVAENYAKRLRNATGDYAAVQMHVGAHTSGAIETEYDVYTPAGGHTYFPTEEKMKAWILQELQEKETNQ